MLVKSKSEIEIRTVSHTVMADPVASGHTATIDMVRKEEWYIPFVREAGCSSNTMSPGPRPTSVPSGILIHPAVRPQKTWAENWGLQAMRRFWAGGSWVPI